jgi:hypothetical protein
MRWLWLTRTIHKSQGSQYLAVVIPLTTQHYPMLQRNLLYTAVRQAARRHRRAEEGDGDRGEGEADETQVVETEGVAGVSRLIASRTTARPVPPRRRRSESSCCSTGSASPAKRLEHVANNDPATVRIISDNLVYAPQEPSAE